MRLEPTKRRRLIVVTSRAYYILKEPLGQRCSACDAHLFCPAGPVPVQRLNFRDVHAITIGHGCGQRVRILWSRHRVTLDKPAKAIQFSVTSLGVVDKIAHAIHELNPMPRPPPLEPDIQTLRVVREKILEPATEEVRLYLQLEKLELGSGRVVPRVAVLTTLQLYLFIVTVVGLPTPAPSLCFPALPRLASPRRCLALASPRLASPLRPPRVGRRTRPTSSSSPTSPPPRSARDGATA